MLTILIIYCAIIAAVSVLGGLVPILMKLSHRGMQMALSMVSGVLIGVAILHMLPHALHEGGTNDGIFMAMLAGFLTLFLLERFFCFHHHESDSATGDGCSHSHHSLGWASALFGLSVHTLIAGVALGSAVAASGTVESLAGFGVFLGIILHKPFDALTITTLMRANGASRALSLLINGLFALVIPIGVVIFFLIDGVADSSRFTGWALAFSAGTFICIACADLLPELQFHQHDRIRLTFALFVGLAIAWLAGLLEGHNHGHDHAAPAAGGEAAVQLQDHDHDH
jgi:zinc and cadmium transporter